MRAPQGEPGESPGVPHVLLGYPLESRIDARHAPGTPGGPSSVEERVGTLAKFVARLAKNGTLRKGYSLKAPADARIVQKCAHIAQGLGISLGYEFSLLENGAFSSDLEMDLCRLEIGRGGTDPFAENEATAAAFERLVAGRETEWLEAATFALHPKSKWRTGAEFAKRRGMIEYDARTARDAFGKLGSRAPLALWVQGKRGGL